MLFLLNTSTTMVELQIESTPKKVIPKKQPMIMVTQLQISATYITKNLSKKKQLGSKNTKQLTMDKATQQVSLFKIENLYLILQINLAAAKKL
mgnify:CR=1 FL=1